MKTNLPIYAVLAYFFCALVCFGFTSVEEDAREAAARAECEKLVERASVISCNLWARNDLRAMGKAFAWPAWLSYRAAIAVTNNGKQQ